jgi:putative methyltransferase (TIGR04325 family)
MRLLRRMLPWRAVAMLRLLKPSPLRYSRPYRSWEEACRNAGSYADPILLEEERSAVRAVREGRAAYALFGLAQAKLAFRWPLLASLMSIAMWQRAYSGRRLHILDFGGGLGSVYDQHRRFLDTIPDLSWSVVEQPHFVHCGNSEFADDRLRFYETVEEARARGNIDAALFVASIGYLDNPYEVLVGLLKLDIPYLVLVATQLTEAADDVIRVQHIRPPYVTAELPIRFLSRPKLRAILDSRGYEMLADLGTGYLFRRRAEMSAVGI